MRFDSDQLQKLTWVLWIWELLLLLLLVAPSSIAREINGAKVGSHFPASRCSHQSL